jgi:hypothetical protein
MPEPAAVTTPQVERAGARISQESQAALHKVRNTSLHSAIDIMKHCSCDQCTQSFQAFDPDNDGDIDMYGLDDPDGDSGSLYSEGVVDTREAERMATLIIEHLDNFMAPFVKRQQGILTRFASIDVPEPVEPFNPELIRSVVAAEVHSQVAAFEEKVVTTLERAATASSLSEVRSVLTEVKETVERIAAQPASGGPVLNGGQPVNKSPYSQPQYDPRAFWDEAQRRGLLTNHELQMRAAAETAIPMQSRR